MKKAGKIPALQRDLEKMKLEIDQQRLLSQLETLATFSDAEPPAVTRIVFTPTDLRAATERIPAQTFD